MRLMYIDVVGVHVTPRVACSLDLTMRLTTWGDVGRGPVICTWQWQWAQWAQWALIWKKRCKSDVKNLWQIWWQICFVKKIRHRRSIMIYLLFALSWSLMPYEVQLDNSWICSYLFHLHGNRFIANTLLIAHEKFHAEAVVRRLRPGAAPAQLTPSLKSGSIANIAANCSKSIVFWQNFGEVGSDRQKHLNYLNCNFMTFLVEQAWLQKFAALRCASLEGGAGLATGLSMLSRWWLKHQMQPCRHFFESEQIKLIRRSDRQNDTVYMKLTYIMYHRSRKAKDSVWMRSTIPVSSGRDNHSGSHLGTIAQPTSARSTEIMIDWFIDPGETLKVFKTFKCL